MSGLTPRERDCKNFIAGYQAEHGCAPSFDEIMAGIGMKSKSEVHRVIHALRRRGHILFDSFMPRSVEVVPDKDRNFLLGYERGLQDFLEAELNGFALEPKGPRWYVRRVNCEKLLSGPFDSARRALDSIPDILEREGRK